MMLPELTAAGSAVGGLNLLMSVLAASAWDAIIRVPLVAVAVLIVADDRETPR